MPQRAAMAACLVLAMVLKMGLLAPTNAPDVLHKAPSTNASVAESAVEDSLPSYVLFFLKNISSLLAYATEALARVVLWTSCPMNFTFFLPLFIMGLAATACLAAYCLVAAATQAALHTAVRTAKPRSAEATCNGISFSAADATHWPASTLPSSVAANAVYAAQVWAAGLIRAVLRPFDKMRLQLRCFIRGATPGFCSMLSIVLRIFASAQKICAAAGCDRWIRSKSLPQRMIPYVKHIVANPWQLLPGADTVLAFSAYSSLVCYLAWNWNGHAIFALLAVLGLAVSLSCAASAGMKAAWTAAAACLHARLSSGDARDTSTPSCAVATSLDRAAFVGATLWAILNGALRYTRFIFLGVLHIVAIAHIMCAAGGAQAFLGYPLRLALREILVSIMLADFAIRAASSPFCWYRWLHHSMKLWLDPSSSHDPRPRPSLLPNAPSGPMLSVCFTLHQTMNWRNSGWPLFAFFAVVGLSAAVSPLMWRLGMAAAKRAWRAAHWLSKAVTGLMWRLMAIIARVALALVCLLFLAIAAALAAAFLPAEQAVLRLITSACTSTPQTSASEVPAAVCAAAQQPWPPSKLVRASSAPAAVQAARALPGNTSALPCSCSAHAATSRADELAPTQPKHTATQSSASTGPSAGTCPPHPQAAPDTPFAPPCSMMATAPEAAGAQSATQSIRATEVPSIQAEANFAHTPQDSHTAAAPAPISTRQVPYSGTGATATVRLGGMETSSRKAGKAKQRLQTAWTKAKKAAAKLKKPSFRFSLCMCRPRTHSIDDLDES